MTTIEFRTDATYSGTGNRRRVFNYLGRRFDVGKKAVRSTRDRVYTHTYIYIYYSIVAWWTVSYRPTRVKRVRTKFRVENYTADAGVTVEFRIVITVTARVRRINVGNEQVTIDIQYRPRIVDITSSRFGDVIRYTCDLARSITTRSARVYKYGTCFDTLFCFFFFYLTRLLFGTFVLVNVSRPSFFGDGK